MFRADIVTMELGQESSLDCPFHWDQPISAMQQESIATYGNDEGRIHLAGHVSVTPKTLEAMAAMPSPAVQLAVASNPARRLGLSRRWRAITRMLCGLRRMKRSSTSRGRSVRLRRDSRTRGCSGSGRG